MTPRNYREAYIQGVQAATRVHAELASDRLDDSGRRVDVFRSIDERGIALLFRPLDGLLGLCLRDPCPGVLVTTGRSLPVQRFTAAHELGHLEMGHDFSLDDEEQIWRPRGGSPKMLQEVAANAFGAEFLMPKSLLRRTMEQHQWNAGDLGDPLVIYQLSLRVGVSYQAMCVSLNRHKWIDQQTLDGLMKISPKAIKAQLLDGVVLEDPWADVWSLTEADHDGEIEAGPNDVFLLKLREHGGSGYLWNADNLVAHGFAVERHEGPSAMETVGSALTRCWKISAGFPSEGSLSLEERRPWLADDVIGQFSLAYSLWGKEAGNSSVPAPPSSGRVRGEPKMHIVADLRDHFGAIRDQGQRPTCLAMSASDLHGSHQGAIMLSAEYLFYQGVRRKTPPDPHTGLTIGAVSTALGADGQPLEESWPYHAIQPAPWRPPDELGRIWKGEMEFRRVSADEAAQMIGSGTPLVLGLALTTAFFTPDKAGRLLVHQGDSDTPHRHAVVGLGVAYSSDGDMHVLVRNSWGAGWGANGHAWLSVGYLAKQLLWIGSIGGAATNEAH